MEDHGNKIIRVLSFWDLEFHKYSSSGIIANSMLNHWDSGKNFTDEIRTLDSLIFGCKF